MVLDSGQAIYPRSERFIGTGATANKRREGNTQQSTAVLIGVAAVAIFFCGCTTHATQLHQGQSALAKGDYEQALAHFEAAEEDDPRAASLGLCVAAFDSRTHDGDMVNYCTQATERGNKLPDQINENLCRREVGDDAPQYLWTSAFCQNTMPEARTRISTSLRERIGVEIDEAISRSDFSVADNQLAIYRQIRDASSVSIGNWQKQIIDGKTRAKETKEDGTANGQHCYLWDLDQGVEGCSIFDCVAKNGERERLKLCEDKPGACEAPGAVDPGEIKRCKAIGPIPKENCPVDWPKWAKQHSDVPFTTDESRACRQYAVCVGNITGFLAADPSAKRETVQRWAIDQTEMDVSICYGFSGADMRRWVDTFYQQRPSRTCAAHMALFACFSSLVRDDD